MLEKVLENFGTAIDIRGFILNLVVTAALGYLFSFVVIRYSARNKFRHKLIRMLTVIACTSAFVATIISSSAAIALGMAGAISVVRFRQILPDVEHIVLVFVAAAAGAGVGMGHMPETILGLIFILGLMSYSGIIERRRVKKCIVRIESDSQMDDPQLKSISGAFQFSRLLKMESTTNRSFIELQCDLENVSALQEISIKLSGLGLPGRYSVFYSEK